jgi:hypothetical protein
MGEEIMELVPTAAWMANSTTRETLKLLKEELSFSGCREMYQNYI